MKAVMGFEQFADAVVLSEPQEFLRALFNAPTIGLAILDDRLRFRAVNKGLAAMNGLAPRAHLGKTIRAALGSDAAALEGPFEHVFSSGRELLNREVCAKLQNRTEVGYWIEDYLPLRDATGRVKQVGAVVVEITEQRKLQRSLRSVTNGLIRNLFLTARDSDGLVRQIIEESLTQTPHFGANRNRPAVTIPSVQAVREVLEGGSERDANAKEYVAPLTSKEREVVKLLVEGNGNKQTAAMLGISVKTVEAHRATIMHKLGLRSTRELMRYAFNKKIVAPADF